MRISAKAEYACLAIIELAKPGGNGSPKRIRDIAEAQGLPERYLVQILLQLKAAGLVHSARGSVGGYHLVRSAEEISVADIIAAIDGPGEPPRKAASPAARELAEVFERARAAELDVLASAKVDQLTRPAASHDWVL
ncbi:MAG: Rrf2 family transcriptional regulator [Isosphaeraceae bacterium]|nr:Rrf2 family transcriptional regulator [Isosphaeraceae bacterium]